MTSVRQVARIKPPALQSGDSVGIVAPASNVRPEDLEAGCAALRGLGYKPFYFESILERDLYFAGSAERRARELEEMFVRDEVRAIVCARGGYGSNYLLRVLDSEQDQGAPQDFRRLQRPDHAADLLRGLGRNDYLSRPHGGQGFRARRRRRSGFLGERAEWSVGMGPGTWMPDVKSLVEGSAEGILYGGCLSILVASLGTPYEIRTAGTILFLEDVAAKPFQIDRMLMQLKLAGKLAEVRGIIFGEMLDCTQNQTDQNKEQGYTLEEVVLRVVGDLGVPVAYGLRSGHVSRRNITLPFGVHAALQVAAGDVNLKIMEAATVAAVSSRSAR